MSHGKQFTLYSHKIGPNGWKVAFLFEELGLTYETVWLEFDKNQQKQSPHIDLNPNGRIPTIIDHYNNDFVLWESNAILLYLVDKYDKDGKLRLSNPNDEYLQLQWLFFQASGQGPYYGQATHFISHHPVRVPTAVERYQDETKRVISVLESVLSKEEWIVGGKFGLAEIALFPWHDIAERTIFPSGTYDTAKEAPHVRAWYERLKERPSIKKCWAEREESVTAFQVIEKVSLAHKSLEEASKQ
ncbi:glutathione S-transferase [Neolentinus lepideus HHB14362 ss-1]|uniref:glutathione transferase n=1 Tax=Neolentinus lepideus HHB14362 ss-1 TaxID=1314782 RepID=A0A165R5I6_9AGAM|nr:glutathione S-transferase [Neolentinus lepideus HHB14362 ss-1]